MWPASSTPLSPPSPLLPHASQRRTKATASRTAPETSKTAASTAPSTTILASILLQVASSGEYPPGHQGGHWHWPGCGTGLHGLYGRHWDIVIIVHRVSEGVRTIVTERRGCGHHTRRGSREEYIYNVNQYTYLEESEPNINILLGSDSSKYFY